MKSSICAKHLLIWLVMLLLMIANGAVRDLLYGRHMSELAAHQLSTASGIAMLGALMWGFLRRHPPASSHDALAIGVLWAGLTVAFEFLFFHFLLGHPWSALLSNYDLTAGRIWVLLLCWTVTAPWLFFRLFRRP